MLSKDKLASVQQQLVIEQERSRSKVREYEMQIEFIKQKARSELENANAEVERLAVANQRLMRHLRNEGANQPQSPPRLLSSSTSSFDVAFELSNRLSSLRNQCQSISCFHDPGQYSNRFLDFEALDREDNILPRKKSVARSPFL